MQPRDGALRSKRFSVAEKARKVASIETMIVDFDHIASALWRQIVAEEQRTGVKDPKHFAYSTLANAARARRANLMNSIADLKMKLAAAKREHAVVAQELTRLEPPDRREPDRQLLRQDRGSAADVHHAPRT